MLSRSRSFYVKDKREEWVIKRGFLDYSASVELSFLSEEYRIEGGTGIEERRKRD